MSLSLFLYLLPRTFSVKFSRLGSFYKQIGLLEMFQTKAICKVITPFPETSPGSTGHPEVNDAFVPTLLIFFYTLHTMLSFYWTYHYM